MGYLLTRQKRIKIHQTEQMMYLLNGEHKVFHGMKQKSFGYRKLLSDLLFDFDGAPYVLVRSGNWVLLFLERNYGNIDAGWSLSSPKIWRLPKTLDRFAIIIARNGA